MKKLLVHLSGRQVFGAVLLLFFMASCSTSPYRYVKVDPTMPIQKVEKTSPQETTDVVATVSTAQAEAVVDDAEPVAVNPVAQGLSTPVDKVDIRPAVNEQNERNIASASNSATPPKETKLQTPNTRQVVSSELNKTAEFNALSQKKQARLVNKISKKVERIKAKSNGSATDSIGFNQWMKIGVILLLVGLVVGLLWGALGWVVSVIGLVFLILGLVQQM